MIEHTIETRMGQAAAVAASARSIFSAVESLVRKYRDDVETLEVPGWRAFYPTADQVAEVRRIIVAESMPGCSAQFVIPDDADTNVIVQSGRVAIHDLDGSGAVLAVREAYPRGEQFFHVSRGEHVTLEALEQPAKVLLVCWRDADSAGDDARAV